jgi:CBS domain containing-hemolysin-like protein
MTLLALFLLGCAMGFLGCIELAFTMLMRLSLRLMAERSGRNDRLGVYLDEPLHLFIPVRILIGLCVVLASVFTARLLPVTGIQSGGAFFFLLIVFVMVSEHIVPRLIVRRDPERAMDILLPVFYPVAQALQPLTTALTEAVDAWGSHDDGNQTNRRGQNVDLETLKNPEYGAAMSDEEGRELLQSIVDFTDTVVREVMTPRPDIVAMSETSSLEHVRSVFRDERYSRVPVYRNDLDNIIGVVFVKDIAALPFEGNPLLSALIRPAYFVPESKRAAELLKDLQRHQVQLAIVVDEYGGTAGLVTVEDLLEEIVGEIRDEYDDESETVTDEGHGVFVFNGKVNVDEVYDRLGVEIEREGFETVGGYLLSHLGRMPYLGETFEVGELRVSVVEVERRRITKVRVTRIEDARHEDP